MRCWQNRCETLLVIILMLLVFLPAAMGTIHRVPDDYPTIQSALDAASDNDRIIVADGVYTGDGNRDLNTLGKRIELTSENGPEVTIIDVEGSASENHIAFEFDHQESRTTIINGFTITGAYVYRDFGEASRNTVYLQNAEPSFYNCHFKDNISTGIFSNGGAVYCGAGSPYFGNCVFSGNSAWDIGGAVYVAGGHPLLENCLIVNNSASDGNGGAVGVGFGCGVTLAYCTVSDNSGQNYGGAFSCDMLTNLHLTHCIVWNNGPSAFDMNSFASVNAEYSDIEGGYQGTGNMDVNPEFCAGTCGEYYLSQLAAGQSINSPCVDAGVNSAGNSSFEMSHGTVAYTSVTTRSDDICDQGQVDLGYHYLPAGFQPPPPVDNVGVELLCPTLVHPGDDFWLNARVWSDDTALADIPFCVLLQIGSQLWFWPEWTQNQFDCQQITVPAGETIIPVIDSFTWPDTGKDASYSLWFYGAFLNREMSDIMGLYARKGWGYGPV